METSREREFYDRYRGVPVGKFWKIREKYF